MSRAWWIGLSAAALLAAGCGGAKEDPLLALSADEALAEGKLLMEREKYQRAQEYLTHAFEIEPNSASGREGLLLAADALYLAGGQTNFIKAESKYRDFLNRFPTSERSAYVQFQMANSLMKRMRKPDRDQSVSQQALSAYREVVRIYPDSEYASMAQEQIGLVRENLAEHEFVIGRFNYRFRLYDAAVARFNTVLEEYPDSVVMDRTLFHLGMALLRLQKIEEAAEAFERLRNEFPDSPYLEKVPGAPPEEEAA